MRTTLTSKGQVTVPKHIRDALGLQPGTLVEFIVDDRGQVVLTTGQDSRTRSAARDRFAAARGTASIKWRTDDLMRLLRGD